MAAVNLFMDFFFLPSVRFNDILYIFNSESENHNKNNVALALFGVYERIYICEYVKRVCIKLQSVQCFIGCYCIWKWYRSIGFCHGHHKEDGGDRVGQCGRETHALVLTLMNIQLTFLYSKSISIHGWFLFIGYFFAFRLDSLTE